MNGVTPRQRDHYHHGDLRNALVKAALELLERDGMDRLSLRALSGAVGVSHGAPTHHFGTLKGLRTALAAIGYQRFTCAMQTACKAAPPDAIDQLRAAGRGYLAFARGQPALFRLMFTAELLACDDPDLQHHARLARAHLSLICAPVAAILGLTDPVARLALEQLVWSHAHGQSHLAIDGQFGSACEGSVADPWPRDLLGELFDRLRKDRPAG